MARRLSANRRGYDTRWKAAAARYLASHPWCRYHAMRGEHVRATVVDHIRPHRGDTKVFWDRTNWQPLCKGCHDSAKQREDRTGRPLGCDERGQPLDPRHHWHRGGGV